MALRGKLSVSEHSSKNSYITKRTNRKSRASRSLVDHFRNESGADLSGRRNSRRLREKQEDVLSESLLCEVGDSIVNSRVISELEQSVDVTDVQNKSNLNTDCKLSNRLKSCGEVQKTNKNGSPGIAENCDSFETLPTTTARVNSDSPSSDSTASLNSFECDISKKVKLVDSNKKNKSSCLSSNRSKSNIKQNCKPDDLFAVTNSKRLSSASHNATRGSFGSPQLVEESPDVVHMSILAAKGLHVSHKTGVNNKKGSPGEQSTSATHSSKSPSPKCVEVMSPGNNLLENVTPKTRKELGRISGDRTQGKELFKKLLEVARATLSRSAQKAAMLSSPAIDGITSLNRVTPKSQHKILVEGSKVTPTHQSHANTSPFPTKAHASNRNIPATPKTPKSVHFRDFSPSPGLSKISLPRSAVCSPGPVPCGNSFKTPEQQRFAPANEKFTTPVNQRLPPSGGRVPLAGTESPIPDTQPISAVLLKDVVAYVEVRSNGEDRSAGVKSHLQELGATVVDRLSKRVTHVLFKEGLLSTYNKAMKWHIPLVTLQWIEECKKRECVVSERLFLPSNLDEYQSPDPLKKVKRVKYFHTDSEDGQKSRKPTTKKLERLKMELGETDASTETDTDSLIGNIRDKEKNMSRENRLLHTLQRLVESGEKSCRQDDSSSPTSDDEMCIPLAVRLLRQLQNSDNRKHGCKDIDENISVRPVDSDGNISKEFVISEKSKGSENRSPRHTNSKSRKKLCLSTEKSSVSKYNGMKGTVSSPECSSVRLPVETASPKETEIQDELIDLLPGKNPLVDSVVNTTINSSLISCSSKGKGRKRKLMPLSQSSSPTVADTTLLTQDPPPCLPGTSKRRRICTRISEEMDLTQCVPASNKDHVTETASSSATTPLTRSEQPQTPTSSSALKRTRKRLTRRSVAVPSPSLSPQLVLTRRSSGVFIKVKAKQERMSRHFPTLVLTSFPKQDVEMIAACVVKLSGFQLEAKVSARTTHVIANGPRRTLNMLKGIARGCWILTQEWVLKSLEAGKWLPEEPFEINNFSPAVAQCRMERECLGPGFRLDLFKSCGPMIIAKQSKPPTEDLKELVKLCGGQVANSVKNADFAIGFKVRNESIVCLSEKWILDCVTQLNIQPTKDYVLDRRQSNCVG